MARDLLACTRLARLTIVDWDPAVTRLFRTHPELRALNRDALIDRRVTLVHRDVRAALRERGDELDLVIGDLTDPTPDDLASQELYSTEFYSTVCRRLSAAGLLVTHASSLDGAGEPTHVRDALEAAGLVTLAYARDTPTFGRVSYVIAARRPERLEPARAYVRDRGWALLPRDPDGNPIELHEKP